MAVVM